MNQRPCQHCKELLGALVLIDGILIETADIESRLSVHGRRVRGNLFEARELIRQNRDHVEGSQ